jgi:hypothetical protein
LEANTLPELNLATELKIDSGSSAPSRVPSTNALTSPFAHAPMSSPSVPLPSNNSNNITTSVAHQVPFQHFQSTSQTALAQQLLQQQFLLQQQQQQQALPDSSQQSPTLYAQASTKPGNEPHVTTEEENIFISYDSFKRQLRKINSGRFVPPVTDGTNAPSPVNSPTAGDFPRSNSGLQTIPKNETVVVVNSENEEVEIITTLSVNKI